MSDPLGQPLSVQAWLAVPVLFAAAVLGLVAMLGILIDADWQATLSSALWGAAAAVTALIDVQPESWPAGCRWALRIGYPVLVFGLGLLLGGVTIPTHTAVAIGLPALGVLVLLCRQARSRRR
ncbi:hypothetical protein [Actinophytocola sediminis]